MTRALLVVLVLLLPRPAAADPDPFAAHLGERWFRLTIAGKRAGWRHWTIRRVGDTYVSRDRALLRLRDDGEVTETRTDETWTFDARPPYRLRALRSTTRSPRDRVVVTGTRDGDRWRVVRDGPDRTTRDTVTAQTLDGFLRPNLAAVARAKPGQTWTVTGFSVDRLTDERERLRLVAVTRDRYHFRGIAEDRTRIDYHLDARGRVLRVKIGALLELVRTTADDARKPADAFDRLADALIRTPPLGPPEHVTRLRLTLRGFPPAQLTATPRQRVLRVDGDAVTLAISRDAGPLPEPDATARARALEAEPSLSITHPAIVALARKLAAGTTGRAAAARLSAGVHALLDQTYGSDATSALAVLENRRGDCTEHALLFVALARALRIPAREVSGLVHLWDGDRSGFAYHSWVEVLADGGWHELDPTWNQDRVDATHVRLVADARRAGVLTNVQGTLKVELLRDDTPTPERLTLRDGRALVGRTVAIDDGHLRFRTPTAHLRLPRRAIAAIDFRHAQPVRVDGRTVRDRSRGLSLTAPTGWRPVIGARMTTGLPGAIAEFRRPGGDGGVAVLVVETAAGSADAHADKAAQALGLTQTQRASLPGDVALRVLAGKGHRYQIAVAVRQGTAVRLFAWYRDDARTAPARAADVRALIDSLRWTGPPPPAAGQ